jgi:hypothetical protein
MSGEIARQDKKEFEAVEDREDDEFTRFMLMSAAIESLRRQIAAKKSSQLVALTGNFPVRIYLSHATKKQIGEIKSAVKQLSRAFDLRMEREDPDQIGSWAKKWLFRFADFLTKPEIAKRLDKIERAFEITHLNGPQASVDEKQVAAISKLISAVKDVPNAAIQAGSILLVKTTINKRVSVTVRTLTVAGLHFLNTNPDSLNSPNKLLSTLSRVKGLSPATPSADAEHKPAQVSDQATAQPS